MNQEDVFVAAKVNWDHIPSLAELEMFMTISEGYTLRPSKIPSFATYAKKMRKGAYKKPFKYKPSEYVLHETKEVKEIKQMYEDNGFDTQVILQDPFGHPGPTVTCPIGFPVNLPAHIPELRKFNRWICRVHVDIVKHRNEQVISIPHIEPDPSFHKGAHFWDTYIKGNVIRGEAAVKCLHLLGI